MEFGLSENQAKVYLCIVKNPKANINVIAPLTKIHRQDIYKILPKLEKMGLIMKTVERPTTIRALAPEKALNHLITLEQEKAKQKIKLLEEKLNILTNEIRQTQNEENSEIDQSIQTIFLSNDNAIKITLDQAYGNARKKCDIIIDFELMKKRLPVLEYRFQALATNKVRTRVLLDCADNMEATKKMLSQIIPASGNFTVKNAGRTSLKPYIIFDNKDLYISTQRQTLLHLPCIIYTNSRNIRSTFQQNFDNAWKNSQPIVPYSQKEKSLKNQPTVIA